MARELFIIDGHSQIHRAYHAPFQNLTGPEGSCSHCEGSGEVKKEVCPACMGDTREPTKASFLFTQMLVRLVRERNPAYLAVAFDGFRKDLLRRKVSPKYKAHRKETLPSLSVQLLRCRQIVQALGVPMLAVKGYEADDIMATLASRYASDTLHIRLVTRDKDLMPLLSDPRVKFYDVQQREEMGEEFVREKMSLKPSQVADYLTLVGDTSDGIDGVSGIGDKSALKLLTQYGSLKKMMNSPTFRLSPDPLGRRVWKAVEDGSLQLAKELVRLEREVPLEVRLKDLRCEGLDLKRAAPIFRTLGFRRW